MVELKLSRPPQGNDSNIPTDRNRGQASKPKKHRGKKSQNKTKPEPETETDFQGLCTDLEGFTFELGPSAAAKSFQNNERTGEITWSNIE